MSQTQDVAVTYIGNDDPFKDRLYRSGLTFARGQTRLVPATLAARFLQHADVFKGADAVATDEDPEQRDEPKQTDDTQQQLDEAKKREDEQREQDDARFALLDSIESMDKQALLVFAAEKFGQKLHPNTGEAKLRDMVKGFVDQYGMP